MRRSTPTLLAAALLAALSAAAPSRAQDRPALSVAAPAPRPAPSREELQGLRDAATAAPDSALGRDSARAYLASLDQLLARTVQSRADIDIFAYQVQDLSRLFCRDVLSFADPCLPLLKKRAALEVLSAGPGARDGKECVIEARMEVWRDAGEALCRAGSPHCRGMDAWLAGTADQLEAGGKSIRALLVRRALLDERYPFSDGVFYAPAACGAARGYASIGVFDRASEFFIKCGAAKAPSADSPWALEQAILLRLGLGDSAGAAEAFSLFDERFHKAHPTVGGLIALEVARSAAAMEDPAKAEAVAQWGLVRDVAPDVELRLRAALGRAAAARGASGQAAAERHYRKLVAEWKAGDSLGVDPLDDEMRMIDVYPVEGEAGARRVEAAHDAVGEALFFLAERAREKAGALSPPPYKGKTDKKAVVRFLRAEGEPWFKRAQRRIEELEEAYREVDAMGKGAPASWVIAANERVGTLWATFERDLRSLPEAPFEVPAAWKGAGIEWKVLHAEPVETPADKAHERAMEAYRRCDEASVKALVKTDAATRCDTWLSKAHPAIHPPMEELFSAGMRSPEGPAPGRAAALE